MAVFISGSENLLENGNARTLLTILQLGIIYFVGVFLYRRYLHPLAKFPGPAAAAVSTQWLYRTLMTRHAEEIFEKLHAQYHTKALRISPNELHISDPHQYKVIYNQLNPFPKHAAFYDGFNVPHAVFAETDPKLHKERRDLLKPFFSRATLLKIEDLIHQRAGVLVKKVERLSKSKTSINIIQAIRCLIFDVTLRFSFADSSNLLEEEHDSFESSVVRPFDALSGRLFTNIEWPTWNKASKCMPTALRQLMYPQGASFSEIISLARGCITNYEKHSNTTSHPVIFDCLSSLPPDQKLAEAVDMLFAGSDTTATSLTTGILYILLDPNVHRKVVEALHDVKPDENGAFPLQELEKVDYLMACVKESLRMAAAIPGRLPRVVPGNLAQPFMVDGKVIPEGTIVSISAYTMNFSEELWGPDARTFNPERWLQAESKDLNQYLCTFSKGRRMCMGQNLASAEILILLAYLFKNFKLSLPSDFCMPEIQDVYVNRFPTGLPVRFEKV
ncbi:cytochrome P450 [Aspergillus floccosus]